MSYAIVQDKPLDGWRRIFRFAYFPYTIWEGKTPTEPGTGRRCVGVTDTMRGARRKMRRDQAQGNFREIVKEIV